MSDTTNVKRRKFLLGLTAGGAGAAAAVIGGKAALESAAPTADNGRRASKGYQLTEHVRNYYRTARV